MAKGFTKLLVISQKPIPVDEELRVAHDELIAKRKWTLILRYNSYTYDQSRFVTLFRCLLIMARVNKAPGLHRGSFCQLTMTLYRSQCQVVPVNTSLQQLRMSVQHRLEQILRNKFKGQSTNLISIWLKVLMLLVNPKILIIRILFQKLQQTRKPFSMTTRANRILWVVCLMSYV